ncbi:MAG: TolC family protein [Proteobacteria bacterium]|nr:TolC family protein [Pseudomonadota bacterium]
MAPSDRGFHCFRSPLQALGWAGLAAIIFLFTSVGHAQPSPPSSPPSPGGDSDEKRQARAAARRVDLPALIRLAINGPRARMARHQTRAADARIDEVTGAAYPKLTMTVHASPSPDIACANTDCTRTDPADGLTGFGGIAAGAKITALQPLLGFGRTGPITRAVRAAARASAFLEDAVAGDLAVDAARAYYGLKLARELAWMLDGGLADIDKALETIQHLIDEGSGEATLQDRLRVATLRAEVEARLTEAKEAEAITLAGVRALAGHASLDIDDQPIAPDELTLQPVEVYLSRTRSARPELKAARAGAEAARAKYKFEAAQFRPILFLVAEYELNRASGIDDPPTLFAADRYNYHSFQAGLMLRWHIDWFAQRARVTGARAQADQADALVQLAHTGAQFEVRRAHAQASLARARMEAAKKGEKSARSWVASVLQASALGTVESKELADALVAYFTLRSRYVTSVFEWNLATVRLRRAVGGFAAAN